MHNDKRFNVIHTRMDTVVGTFDHIDLAQAFLRSPETKDFHVIDRWTGVEVDRPAESAARTGVLNPDELPFHTIDQMIMGSHKIMAIKLIRELTGLGLGEAKSIADRRQSIRGTRGF